MMIIHKRVLEVNLTNKTHNITEIPISELNLEARLGGIGLITQLTKEYVTKKLEDEEKEEILVDAYDPSIPLIFATGVFSGSTVATGLRTIVGGIGPLKSNPRCHSSR